MSHVHVHEYHGCGCLQTMGPCNTCKRSAPPISEAIQVVHLDGFLEEYDAPITVEQIIKSFPKHFMTTPIQLINGLVLLKLDTLLEPGRVYFVLPYSILRVNESSKDFISLAKKLTSIAKAHRSKPKPTPFASLLEKGSSQRSNPCTNESSRDLSLAKKFTSIVRAHRSKPNLAPLAILPQETRSRQGSSPQEIRTRQCSSPQETRSRQCSSPLHNDMCSIDLIRLANKLRSISKAYWSKPKPRPRPARMASIQERGLSQDSDPSPNEENTDMSRSTKMLSWKPLLATIREISFNRRESDLRD